MFYIKSNGDLAKVGKISIKKEYSNIFDNENRMTREYIKFSELNLNETNSFDILTIGDSFSQRGNCGYQNYIAHKSNMKIVNFNKKKYSIPQYNPLQFLYQIVNGNLFTNFKLRYIILQSSERDFIVRSFNLNRNAALSVNKINKFERKFEVNDDDSQTSLFIDIIKFPLFSILYNFNNKAYLSKTYKMKLTKDLFSIENNMFLFYYGDLLNIGHVRKKTVKNLNKELNLLSEKLNKINIKLIVLPGPDKFDLYYDYISDNNYPKNLFFDLMKKEKKNYIYVDTKELLMKYLKAGEKDIYLVDDTHWSPKAAKIIAEKLLSDITQKTK